MSGEKMTPEYEYLRTIFLYLVVLAVGMDGLAEVGSVSDKRSVKTQLLEFEKLCTMHARPPH